MTNFKKKDVLLLQHRKFLYFTLAPEGYAMRCTAVRVVETEPYSDRLVIAL